MSESTTTALIVGVFSFAGIIAASVTQILIARAARQQIIARVDQGTAQVAELKKNTDGLHSELMALSSRANQAEGKIEGAAIERDRALVTEPQAVTEAMNGSEVREQIDKIEASVTHTQETLAEEPVVRPAIRRQIDKIEAAVSEAEE